MHSAILTTFIKLHVPFVIKIFILSIFEWPFYAGCTVNQTLMSRYLEFLWFLHQATEINYNIQIDCFHVGTDKLSLGSSLIIFSSFLFIRSLVKNDSLGNFDFNRQRYLDFSSNFVG